MKSNGRLFGLSGIGLLLALCRMAPAEPAIPLEILEPPERKEAVKEFPASAGILFTEGELADAAAGALLDDRGRATPFESEATGWWSPEHKSVKWLLVHFKASSDRQYRFHLQGQPVRPEGKPLAAQDGEAVVVDTGSLQVRMTPRDAALFDSVSLNGKAMLAPGDSLLEWKDDEGRLLFGKGWKVILEESTPQRATVRAEGTMGLPGEPPMARLSVRYQFFAGESFIRIYHTFMWLPKSLDPGAGAIGMRIKPQTGVVKALVGLSDFTGETVETTLAPAASLLAFQDDATHFTVQQDGKVLKEGKRLGGWIALAGADGRGVGVALRNLWQTYPKSLGARGGAIEIGLWPAEAGRMSFEERDLMPDALYYSASWKGLPWTKDGGPTWFEVKDVLPGRAEKFLAALKAPDNSVGKRILLKLRPEVKARIEEWTPQTPLSDGFKARVVHAMNAFLAQRDFYDPAAWTGVTLRPKAQTLLQKGVDKLDRPELIWFNRLLIESAFPEDLSHSDIPHFIQEQGPFGVWKGQEFLHTGEGATRTDEITLFFFDAASKRTVAELNSLTQHPLAIRQSPASAMRVPFHGLDIVPADPQHYPDMERAIDQLGRLALGRWAATADYGFWRYGMIRWAGTGVSYRWSDGLQYDMQLIPWLLFMRGGDRSWFEEGETVGRFAMDVQTNHYNTRGVPTGYQAGAEGLPFPAWAEHLGKHTKIHFLSYYYHLTGYPRAREIMDEVIAGTKKDAQTPPPAGSARLKPEYVRNWGRELYNMNTFWVNAYEETGDPEIKVLAREWLDLSLHREYDPKLNAFRQPVVYLYDGLLLQYRLWRDEELKQIMLRNLAGLGFPGQPDGGIYRVEDAIACPWAFGQTGDRRFINQAWDVARTLADLVPDRDWSDENVPVYSIIGNGFYRQYFLPILTGYSLAARNGLTQATDFVLHDNFLTLDAAAKGKAKAKVLVRPKRDGDLKVTLFTIGCYEQLAPPVTVTALDPQGATVATVVIPETPRYVIKDTERRIPPNWLCNQKAELTLPQARAGAVYALQLEADNVPRRPLALVEADAGIVYNVPNGKPFDFYGLAGQMNIGTRIFTRTLEDTITITNRTRRAYSVRDARTGELLFRAALPEPPAREHHFGKDRLILVVADGRGNDLEFQGTAPYLAVTREGYFEP